jgi:Tol biopolymer transport system component
LRGFFKSKAPSEGTRNAFQTTRVSQFTASGNVLTAAISPDGKYVATALNEGGLQSLCLRQVAANTSSVPLTRPALVEYWGLTFSNDGNFIYYVSWARNQSDAELYRLPVLGGAPRRIPVGNIDTPISFSPAGDRFTYITSSKGESYLKVADVEGGGIQTLVTRRKPGFFTAYPGGAAWAPDGRTIAYAAGGSTESDSRRAHVFVADVENKAERRLTEQSWLDVGRVTWSDDGSGLVISAREQMDAPRQLWLVSYPDGSARKITNDLFDYDSVSLSADGKSLAAVQTQGTFSISVAPHRGSNEVSPAPSGDREIFTEVGSGRECISWAPDNRIVYCSRASGAWDIWIMNNDGSGQRQLTIDSRNDLFPAVSADGRFIFFASDRAGAFNIWRMEIDGSNPIQLTRGVKDILPELTPDGRGVIYQQGPAFGMDEINIWRAPAAGGSPERLTDSFTQWPAVSPDGRLLAYVYMDDKGWGIAVVALDRNQEPKKFPFPSTVESHVFRWTPDGGSLAYIVNEKGASNIWLQPLSGERPKQLTNFKPGKLLSFACSAASTEVRAAPGHAYAMPGQGAAAQSLKLAP